MALPFLGPYSASKYALEAMTDCLRLELLPWGITVSIIEPGPVKTPIWEKTRETAGKAAQNYPVQAFELYGPALSAFGAAAEKAAQGGVLPEAVVRAVEHALTARRPKIRYVVGPRAQLQAFLKRILPDRMFDKLIVKRRGLSEKPGS
jgi:NAD(P)-dependent dehydrogenase (short-subunit alcohol dehydrogenase family)